MSALTAARKELQMGVPPEVIPGTIDVKLKAAAKVYVGGVVATDATGYGIAASALTGLICAGIAKPKVGYPQVYDNTSGASGDIVAPVQQGVFSFNVGGSGDVLAQADVGQPVFLIDDNTVGKTDGGATPRPIAGILVGFGPGGVSQAMVMVSFNLNALILSALRTTEQTRKITAIAAAGAVDPTSDVVLATVTGTTAYTIADGTKIGHRLRVVLLAGSGSPIGNFTPATPRGFATVGALGAVGDMFELEWTATGWIPGPSNGVTWA